MESGSLQTTRTDAEIISASRLDRAGFAEVFRRHYPAIFGFLRRRIGTDLAHDLATETFLIAFRRRAAYDTGHTDARPWLFGIASNVLRRHARTERRRLLAYTWTGRDRVALTDPGFDAVEDRMAAQAAAPVIARALATLRAGDREVLLLFAWADLSYAEIAEALEIPIGTVRSRLARARRRVRELLEASGQVPDEKER